MVLKILARALCAVSLTTTASGGSKGGEHRAHSPPPPRAVKLCRAGGNGTAGTAMAVPVLREKKWRCLDSNLRVRYRMASPSG